MHRIDGPGATVDNKFTEGDPVGGVQATVVTDDFMNDVQEELISILAAAGVAPVKGTQNQVLNSIAKLLQSQKLTAFPTTGTATALALTPIPAIDAYASDLRFRVKFNVASGLNPTLNVSAKGAKFLKQYDSSGAKVAAVFAANQISEVEYDGSEWVLVDPLPSNGNLVDSVRVDVASVATLNLTSSAPNTRHINITGTTNITSFVLAAGQCYFVRFAGILAIANNAAIVTQSGANIITAAGDTCIVRATANNVVEILCYTPFKNQAIGYEQTTQDLTASRTSGTTYTNSTGKTIWVSVFTTGSTNWTSSVLVDGKEVVKHVTNNMTSGGQATLVFPVQPGLSYSLTVSNTSISKWWETR